MTILHRAVFFLFLPLLYLSAAENLRAVLEEAYETSRTASYVAEIEQPRLREEKDIAKVVYHRKVEKDGTVLLRVDFYGAQHLHFSFLSNRDGQYAIDASTGTAWQGGDFLRLFWLESLLNRPCREEFSRAEYSGRKTTWKERPCRKITMRIPDDAGTEDGPPVSAFTGFSAAGDAEQRRRHPFTREYLLDNETGVLLSLRKYNAQGQVLSAVSLGEADFHPVWEEHPGLFDTPSKISGRVANAMEFRDRVSQEKDAARQRSFKRRGLQFHRWQLLLALLGGACLAAAVIHHRRQNGNW
ncbi:MAG: hypothetical protein MJ202_07920 [Lentisphaeria bacterium]|nr:hypothetical protein [Lentisphaeria bacterium]